MWLNGKSSWSFSARACETALGRDSRPGLGEGLGPRCISSLAGRLSLMVSTKTGDGAFASRADRRPYQRAHPYRRHLTVHLPRHHFCPSGKILGMSSERHHPNEIIRLDIGRSVIVSLCVSGTVHWHTKT